MSERPNVDDPTGGERGGKSKLGMDPALRKELRKRTSPLQFRVTARTAVEFKRILAELQDKAPKRYRSANDAGAEAIHAWIKQHGGTIHPDDEIE